MNIRPQKIKPRKLNQTRSGFTLIELLMVFAIIALLAAITFGITSGVRNAQNRAKAKVELAAISQAIEEYKAQYGDYPWLISSDPYRTKNLAYALSGRMVLRNVSGSMTPVEITDEDEIENKPKFLDFTKFTTTEESGAINNILDPWGNPYRYYYKWDDNPGAWDVFGYHLFSTGPNGDTADAAIQDKMDMSTGVLDDDFRDVADAEGIIFAGE